MSIYSNNRVWYVKINHYKSQLMKVDSGVPQGSLPGPLFSFLIIYVRFQIHQKILSFADDM